MCYDGDGSCYTSNDSNEQWLYSLLVWDSQLHDVQVLAIRIYVAGGLLYLALRDPFSLLTVISTAVLGSNEQQDALTAKMAASATAGKAGADSAAAAGTVPVQCV
jgi:hypothetical protein